jgi:hypothetical protein
MNKTRLALHFTGSHGSWAHCPTSLPFSGPVQQQSFADVLFLDEEQQE